MRGGHAPHDMKLDFQCAGTTSSRGFMSFRRVRSVRAAVLVVLVVLA